MGMRDDTVAIVGKSEISDCRDYIKGAEVRVERGRIRKLKAKNVPSYL